MWAHQISSLTGIIIFFVAIYYFLKHLNGRFTNRDLLMMGLLWITMTIAFETFMNVSIRKLNLQQVFETYYFWKGETWLFVLISLIVLPFIVKQMLERQKR